MYTLNIDGTTYKVKFDRDVLALTKAARKPYKPAKFKDLRKFPKRADLSTAAYIAEFIRLNYLMAVKYDNLNMIGTAQYDPTIPLSEVFTDE